MAAGVPQFAGSVPDTYAATMVPMLFEPYAAELADRIAADRPASILEVAAGTGVLTRALAARLPDARILATDLSQPMLDRAARAADLPTVTWQQADAQRLPVDAASVDVVACQFGIMFVPDKVLAYRQARRALTPGGRLMMSTWESTATNGFAETISDELRALFPDDPPGFIGRIPHGYHDAALISAQLAEAGFTDVDIEAVSLRSHADSAATVAAGFLRGTPTGAEVADRPGSAGLDSILGRVTDALRTRFGDGPIEAEMAALLISARA